MADVELSALGSVIKSAYEGNANTNALTDANKTAVDQLKLGVSGIALLTSAYAVQTGTIAIGENADARGVNDTIGTVPEGMIAIGKDSTAYQHGSIAIGYEAIAGLNSGVNPGNARRSVAIGFQASAQNRHSVAIGHLANADGLNGISIGDTAGIRGSGQKSIAIGNDCGANQAGISIGGGTDGHQYCIAIGDNAKAGADEAFTPQGAVALGREAVSNYTNSVALGSYSETTSANQVRIGSDTQTTNLVVTGSTTVEGATILEGNVTLKYASWPTADGTDGQVLRTNGAGTLSWVTNSSTVSWGGVLGTLTDQTDLQSALDGKLDADGEADTVATINGLVSAGTNVTITGSGTSASPYVIASSGGGGGSTAWGNITGSLSNQTDLQSALDAKQATITDSDDITEGSTNLFMTTSERSKLSGIEASADVTDSTNVLSSLTGQALAVATINTGQGAVECYAMDQATQTTDNVTFGSVVAPVVLNEQTGTTYTLVLTDACKHLDLENAAATTVTVPPNASVAFAVGTRISLAQMGAGQITLAQGAGVTIRTPETLKLRSQYSAAVLTKLAADEWLLTGDLEASA